jgi:hypothetical protein
MTMIATRYGFGMKVALPYVDAVCRATDLLKRNASVCSPRSTSGRLRIETSSIAPPVRWALSTFLCLSRQDNEGVNGYRQASL